MPIRINLLAEQQLQEELRRTDPVRRGIWLAGFVVALVLLWSLSIQLKNWGMSSDVKRMDQTWRSLESKTSMVKTNLKMASEIDAKLEALHGLATNRFLWGSLLNALQFCMVDNIQMVRLKGQQTFTFTPEVKTKTGIRATPATATEANVLTLEARCFSDTSVEKIDQFVRNLKTDSHFKSIYTNDTCIGLKARSQPQSDAPDSGRTFVLFTLECTVPERIRQ